jgi:hypothetical protein
LPDKEPGHGNRTKDADGRDRDREERGWGRGRDTKRQKMDELSAQKWTSCQREKKGEQRGEGRGGGREGGSRTAFCTGMPAAALPPPSTPHPADLSLVSPLRRQSARDEERDSERERERDREREREGEREREWNRESGGVRGGDAGGYRRDDKGRKGGGRDGHGRHRDCYGDRPGSEKSPDLKRKICIDINKQIMGATGASELCTLIEARAAEFNQEVELV